MLTFQVRSDALQEDAKEVLIQESQNRRLPLAVKRSYGLSHEPRITDIETKKFGAQNDEGGMAQIAMSSGMHAPLNTNVSQGVATDGTVPTTHPQMLASGTASTVQMQTQAAIVHAQQQIHQQMAQMQQQIQQQMQQQMLQSGMTMEQVQQEIQKRMQAMAGGEQMPENMNGDDINNDNNNNNNNNGDGDGSPPPMAFNIPEQPQMHQTNEGGISANRFGEKDMIVNDEDENENENESGSKDELLVDDDNGNGGGNGNQTGGGLIGNSRGGPDGDSSDDNNENDENDKNGGGVLLEDNEKEKDIFVPPPTGGTAQSIESFGIASASTSETEDNEVEDMYKNDRRETLA